MNRLLQIKFLRNKLIKASSLLEVNILYALFFGSVLNKFSKEKFYCFCRRQKIDKFFNLKHAIYCGNIDFACQKGHYKCFKFFADKKVPLTKELFEISCHNNVKCLEYLYNHGIIWTTTLCFYANLDPNYEKNDKCPEDCNCPWDFNAISVAASNIKCLKFLHSKNFPNDVWACNWAAYWGDLECLEFMCKNNFSINLEDCYLWAKNNNKQEILNFLIDFYHII